jgi:hypothetical protein
LRGPPSEQVVTAEVTCRGPAWEDVSRDGCPSRRKVEANTGASLECSEWKQFTGAGDCESRGQHWEMRSGSRYMLDTMNPYQPWHMQWDFGFQVFESDLTRDLLLKHHSECCKENIWGDGGTRKTTLEAQLMIYRERMTIGQ